MKNETKSTQRAQAVEHGQQLTLNQVVALTIHEHRKKGAVREGRLPGPRCPRAD